MVATLIAWALIASVPFILLVSALDSLFGWGIADAMRDFLDPVIPDNIGSDDPGDCDPQEMPC